MASSAMAVPNAADHWTSDEPCRCARSSGLLRTSGVTSSRLATSMRSPSVSRPDPPNLLEQATITTTIAKAQTANQVRGICENVESNT